VRITSDDNLVVFHDATVDRTTNGTGSVRLKTVTEMKSLDIAYHYSIEDNGKRIFPERDKGNRVLTFREFMKEFPNTWINIELKDNDLRAAEILKLQLNEIENAKDRIVIASKYCKSVYYIRNAGYCTTACEEEVVQYAILSAFKLYLVWFSIFQEPLAQAFQIPVESALRLDSKEFIDGAHIFNQKVHYWVINDRKTMKDLLLKGADAIVTDRVDLAVEVFKELRIKKNSTQTKSKYYPSDEIPEEIHTCDGFMCKFFSAIFNLEKWHVFIIGIILIAIYWNIIVKTESTKK